jgi:hypothetical protein
MTLLSDPTKLIITPLKAIENHQVVTEKVIEWCLIVSPLGYCTDFLLSA